MPTKTTWATGLPWSVERCTDHVASASFVLAVLTSVARLVDVVRTDQAATASTDRSA
ncbi:hypothetical protein IGS73_06195 [Janibacter indicus]|uniref:Uncharacterized protein n=1 Tax=Janibacter indicus TaxID=857417 RepID=A0A7L9J4K8_9MICO|nr:hypothetical protein [Janibacter indicus]QOK23963.1 hypothetical protein IGS73_06195 [Janibacter indicus]